MGYNCNKAYQKSLLSAYTGFKQILIENQSIDFESINILDGCSIDFTPGSSLINFKKPGAYLVIFNANVKKTDTNGEVILQLQQDEKNIGGAVTNVDTSAMGDTTNIGFSTIVKIKPSCYVLNEGSHVSVVNTGIKAAYSDANITIVKLY